jgi:hypothetical protein
VKQEKRGEPTSQRPTNEGTSATVKKVKYDFPTIRQWRITKKDNLSDKETQILRELVKEL